MKNTFDLLLPQLPFYRSIKDGKVNDLVVLPAINNINIFIGSNNSGKSLFMRNLMVIESYNYIDSNGFSKANELILNYNLRYGNRVDTLKVKFDLPAVIAANIHRPPFNNNPDIINAVLHEEKPRRKIFIPVLRTAHSLYEMDVVESSPIRQNQSYKFNKIEEDIFANTIIHNYRNINKQNIEIFTGLALYKEILNSRNSDRNTREKFQSFEDFVGENFFNGQKVDIVAHFNKSESLKGNNTDELITLSFENETETRKLHDLGDGIQALIILLFKIFMADEGSYIFIDEPEINLHPGMQRVFVEQITSNEFLKNKNLRYFITTHSNHLIDLTLDHSGVSIYSFSPEHTDQKEKQLIVKNVNAGDNTILKNIGVNNSSVFMANCSIWVEGISDRNYIKAFLKSYCKHSDKPYPKEDIDYAFFEYAGSNVDHYFFEREVEEEDRRETIAKDIRALALSNRIFLLADSDDAQVGSAKHTRLTNLLSARSVNFVPRILDKYRELENLLPTEVWRHVLLQFCNKTIVEQIGFQTVQNKINDALRCVSPSTYKKKYIGEFLNEIRNNIGKSGHVFILNESEYQKKDKNIFGTLKNKRWLSEMLLDADLDWECYSKNEDITNLVQEIYKFITAK